MQRIENLLHQPPEKSNNMDAESDLTNTPISHRETPASDPDLKDITPASRDSQGIDALGDGGENTATPTGHLDLDLCTPRNLCEDIRPEFESVIDSPFRNESTVTLFFDKTRGVLDRVITPSKLSTSDVPHDQSLVTDTKLVEDKPLELIPVASTTSSIEIAEQPNVFVNVRRSRPHRGSNRSSPSECSNLSPVDFNTKSAHPQTVCETVTDSSVFKIKYDKFADVSSPAESSDPGSAPPLESDEASCYVAPRRRRRGRSKQKASPQSITSSDFTTVKDRSEGKIDSSLNTAVIDSSRVVNDSSNCPDDTLNLAIMDTTNNTSSIADARSSSCALSGPEMALQMSGIPQVLIDSIQLPFDDNEPPKESRRVKSGRRKSRRSMDFQPTEIPRLSTTPEQTDTGRLLSYLHIRYSTNMSDICTLSNG